MGAPTVLHPVPGLPPGATRSDGGVGTASGASRRAGILPRARVSTSSCRR